MTTRYMITEDHGNPVAYPSRGWAKSVLTTHYDNVEEYVARREAKPNWTCPMSPDELRSFMMRGQEFVETPNVDVVHLHDDSGTGWALWDDGIITHAEAIMREYQGIQTLSEAAIDLLSCHFYSYIGYMGVPIMKIAKAIKVFNTVDLEVQDLGRGEATSPAVLSQFDVSFEDGSIETWFRFENPCESDEDRYEFSLYSSLEEAKERGDASSCNIDDKKSC